MSSEAPHSVTKFGRMLVSSITKTQGLPKNMMSELKDIVQTQHVEFLAALRSNYMIRLLIHAFGDRKVGDKVMSTALKELTSSMESKIVKLDGVCGEDAGSLSSMWGAIMTHIVNDGDIDTDSIMETNTSKNSAVDDGQSNPKKDGQAASDANTAHKLTVQQLLSFRFDPSREKPADADFCIVDVKSADVLAQFQLGIQRDILFRARMLGLSPVGPRGSFLKRGPGSVSILIHYKITKGSHVTRM